MLWDLYQQYRIGQLEEKLDRAQPSTTGDAVARAPRPKRCPKCEAMMSPKFGRCLFCGYRDESATAFT